MKSLYSLIILIIAVGGFFVFRDLNKKQYLTTSSTTINSKESKTSPTILPTPTLAELQPPLDRPKERVTKKKFGTFVTPQNSPVQPERFTGFHTGVDFETFSQELNKEVQVHAVCPGILKLKETASGYGGVVVELCELQGSPVTVVYGHFKLSSVTATQGAGLKAGDVLGVLGAAYSSDTDGERKHLHLDIHKGSDINIAGYVQSQSELSDWIDPCLFICK